MKKTILFFFLLIAFSASSQEYNVIDVYGERELMIYFTPEKIYMSETYKKRYAILDRKYLKPDKDGYLKIDYNGKKFLIIPAGPFSQCFTEFSAVDTNRDRKHDGISNAESVHDSNIKRVRASSFLSEKTKEASIEYSPINLFRAFISPCRCHYGVWDDVHIPWVEGVKGNGIGEDITIEFHEPVNGISILNGFVDRNRMKLYKENSRAKTITIEDTQNYIKQTVEIEDIVQITPIKFDIPTKKIIITIDDVYEGSKHQDTCISAIVDYTDFDDGIGTGREERVKEAIEEIERTYERFYLYERNLN